MSFSIVSKWTEKDKTLSINRVALDQPLMVSITGPNDQQLSFTVDPVSFLQGLRSIYPDLLIQLPS